MAASSSGDGPGSSSASGTSGSAEGDDDDDDDDDDDEPGDSTGDIKYDLPIPDAPRGGSEPICHVQGDLDAPGECEQEAPPESFEPVEEWSFEPDGQWCNVIPLVANLTDDNGDGVIDLCDTPDVVVVGKSDFALPQPATLHVLDGATGVEHFAFETRVRGSVTPALGDLDDDGLPEIVTVTLDGELAVFEHDGEIKWTEPVLDSYSLVNGGAIAIANLDAEGLPEIVLGHQIYDAEGGPPLVLPPGDGHLGFATAADLDGDGDLEVVLGHAAYHHDGAVLWTTELGDGFPSVADLDGDLLPEVLLNNHFGLTLIEHDGTVAYEALQPTGTPNFGWRRPSVVLDFDGDGQAEYAVNSGWEYAVYEGDGTLVWETEVQDHTGAAGSSAFDFLGDGTAEAVFGDEAHLWVFDEAGEPLLQVPRSSGTSREYPVVADVDNDGSAEILALSDHGEAPCLQVWGDVDDRWVQARRIWNQHTYHITNVREDGTIPQHEPPHWETHNTFRAGVQIEGGSTCIPPAG